MVRFVAKCASLLWVLAFAPMARADAQADAESLRREAMRVAKRRPEEALAKLRRAYEVYPTPVYFLHMARIEETLGKKLEALGHYEAVAAADVGVVGESHRSAARSRILELELEIATIVVDAGPAGARILVDGAEVGVAPMRRPLRVLPGRHALRIELAGYDAAEKSLELQAGDRIEEKVRLTPEATPPEPEVKPPAPAIDPDLADLRASRRQVLIASLGFTGLFVVGALVTGVLATSAHARYADRAEPPGEREDARDSGRTLAITTDILLAGALVAGGFATYWYFARVRPISKTVTPYVGLPARGVAVGLQGRF